MKINFNIHNITFKSGYPTFGGDGHLRHKPETYDNLYLAFKPNPSKGGLLIDYKA